MLVHSLLCLFFLTLVTPKHVVECDHFFYPEGCQVNQIAFKRQVFDSNIRKEMSIYARGHSEESIILHMLVLFTDDIHHFHNALLFNPLRMEKYAKILHESDFPFNNEIVVVTKGKETVLQYDVAPLNHPLFMGSVSYDAVLSLDRYASMWSEYNSYTVERSRITLRMNERSEWDENDKQGYRGLYRLDCDDDLSYKHCHVYIDEGYRTIGGDLVINDVPYSGYGLVINTSSTLNLLPYDLYLYWKHHLEKDLYIGGYEDHHLIHLNTQFDWGINHESMDIVLGTDILNLFQKVEFCGEAGYYKLWYSHIYHNNNNHIIHNLVMGFFIIILLSIYFYWVTSPNYDVLQYFLKGDEAFDYPYRMVWWEFVCLCISLLSWLLVLLFTDELGSGTENEKRELLFVLFSAYHVLLSIIFMGVQWRLTRDTGKFYYSYWIYLTYNRRTYPKYEAVVKRINTPTTPVPIRFVIMRNIVIGNLIASSLLLMFNYLSEEKRLFLVAVAGVSLVLVYYYIKLLYVGVLFIHKGDDTWRQVWKKEKGLILMLIFSCAIFLTYFVVSLPIVYISLFDELNSMYCSVVLWVFAVTPLALIILVSLSMVFGQVMWYILPRLSTAPLSYRAVGGGGGDGGGKNKESKKTK